MNDNKLKTNTGGQFLLNSILSTDIYSREDFTEEHHEIYNMIMEFEKEHVLPKQEELQKYDPNLIKPLIKKIGELGLLGIDIPEKFGGLDLDKITSAIVAEALTQSPSLAVTWGVQTGIGSLPIIWFGTDAHKEKYLPKIASGELICAYGLTEPASGSDATMAKTTAILTEDGKHYILNGEKVFITNAGMAGLFTVFAQVDGNKFSAFLVETGTQGFTIGREEKKLGMKGSSTAQLLFQNAKVPAENLLYKVGKGSTIAFNCLNIGRFKLGCSCLGGSKLAINAAVEYAQDRKAFGTNISKFDAIVKKVSDMSIRTFATDSMIYRTIGILQDEIDLLDRDDPNYYILVGEAMEKFAIETSMTKVYGSDTSHWVIDQALQVFGGYGFLEDYPIASAYRDDRINQIWEGTNEINRQIITGFILKKALMEELPFRESIRNIDTFLNTEIDDSANGHLSQECHTVELAKRFALYIFNEAICEYGQDFRHEHQVIEIFADIFTDIFTAESTIIRAQKILDSDSPEQTASDIAKVFSTEMVDRIMSNIYTASSAIFDGKIPDTANKKIAEFEKKMRLKHNIVSLKRKIAQHIFEKNKYPY